VNTLEQAVRAKESIEADVLGKPGVTGIDAGYRSTGGKASSEPVIRIYVADKQRIPSLPSEVDGIPVVVVERRFQPH
jgi:hypothetical protein